MVYLPVLWDGPGVQWFIDIRALENMRIGRDDDVETFLCDWEYLRRWGLTTFDNYYCHAAAARRRMCSFVRPL